MKTLDEVNEIAYKLDELALSQLGDKGDYLVGVGVYSTSNPRHNLPKNYSEEFYICVQGDENMKRPDELKIPEYQDGIFITEEQTGRSQFA